MTRILSPAALLILLFAIAAQAATPPSHLWSESFGGTGTDSPTDVEIDGAGNIFITGVFTGTTNLGGGPLVSLGLEEGFLAKYNPSGAHLWSRRFGTTSFDGGGDIAVDPSGNVIVTGHVSFNVLVRKYDAAGTQVWTKQIGGANTDEGAGVATDALGNIFVTGYFHGSIDFGGGPLTATGEFSDMFIVKFDAAGAHQWSKSFDCASRNLATDGSGAVTITGSFDNAVDFGGGPLPSAGGTDAFLVRFNAGGVHLWSKSMGGTSNDGGVDVACNAGGDVVLAGVFAGASNFGGAPLASNGLNDIVVARYDAAGLHQWSQGFGGTGNETVSDLALDALGSVLVTGGFNGTVDFGSGPVASGGDADIYIKKSDLVGAHQWVVRAGDTSSDMGGAVAVDNVAGIVATGEFQLSADFGGGPLPNAGGRDVYLVKLFDEPPVPVRISNFNARLRGHDVELTWDVWSDEDLRTYAVYRSEAGKSPAVIAEGAFSAARGFTDRNTRPGKTYRYELLLDTASGSQIRSQAATVHIPRFVTALAQNSPNPFRSETTIEYTLAERARASVGIYDAAGRLVVRLDDGEHDAGTYRMEWNGRNSSGQPVGSGVYFYRLSAAGPTMTRKMVIAR